MIHFLADGGAWIRTTRRAMFPGSQYTLDLYHLKRNAHVVLPQRQAKKFLSLVMTGLAETAIDYLEHIKPIDDQHAQELQQFRNYVKDNRDGLRYRRGQLNGSGVIEKMADLVVKKRMKRQGMRWSQGGANNLLALRVRHLNAQASLRSPPYGRSQTINPISSPH